MESLFQHFAFSKGDTANAHPFQLFLILFHNSIFFFKLLIFYAVWNILKKEELWSHQCMLKMRLCHLSNAKHKTFLFLQYAIEKFFCF